MFDIKRPLVNTIGDFILVPIIERRAKEAAKEAGLPQTESATAASYICGVIVGASNSNPELARSLLRIRTKIRKAIRKGTDIDFDTAEIEKIDAVLNTDTTLTHWMRGQIDWALSPSSWADSDLDDFIEVYNIAGYTIPGLADRLDDNADYAATDTLRPRADPTLKPIIKGAR